MRRGARSGERGGGVRRHLERVLFYDSENTHIVVKEPAAAELDLEVDDLDSSLRNGNRLATALIVAVPLHVHHAVEVGVPQVDLHQHAVSQAVHLQHTVFVI
jgi:hypothetical protein